MAHELHGRVWLLPDDVETNQILPYTAFTEHEPEALSTQCLEAVVPGIGAKIEPGDILWAGEAFGHGSSREDAPRALKALGVRLVLAQSFARIFYRNAINIGLPVAIGDSGATRDGDELEVNLVTGDLRNLTRKTTQRIEAVPKAIRPILSAGGLIAYVRENERLGSQT